MSHAAIADTSRTLLELLRPANGNETVHVRFMSPAESIDSDGVIGLFPYAFIEDPYLKNEDRRPQQATQPTRLTRAPLTLDVYYMLTAYSNASTDGSSALLAQERLGQAMRVLYDKGIVRDPYLHGSLAGRNLELRVTLQPVTVEDLTRIWSMFPERSYQPSVIYLVTPVPIESELVEEVTPVVDRSADFGQMPQGAPRRLEVINT